MQKRDPLVNHQRTDTLHHAVTGAHHYIVFTVVNINGAVASMIRAMLGAYLHETMKRRLMIIASLKSPERCFTE